MKLVLPLPPNFSNDGRQHWRKKYNAQQKYFRQLDELLICQQVEPPPLQIPARIGLSAVLYVWSEMDDDGAMARLKWPVDWMRTRGYVADDKRKNIKWAGLPGQVVDRKNQRLELEITPLEAA